MASGAPPKVGIKLKLPKPGGPTPPFVPGVSIPPLAPPTPSAQIPYSGHGPALSHPHQHQPPSSVLGPAMLPHHPHLQQPPSVLPGPVMLPHHPHQQKPPCGPGPYMLPHNHSKQQGYAGPGLTLALEEVLNTGKYIMPGFSAVARGILEARGLTFESAMAFLVSMPGCPLKDNLMRRLLGNCVEVVVDEAVEADDLALLAAQPRPLVEKQLLREYGIDLTRGRSKFYVNESVLPNDIKKALRDRGEDLLQRYQNLRNRQKPQAMFSINKSSSFNNAHVNSSAVALGPGGSASTTHRAPPQIAPAAPAAGPSAQPGTNHLARIEQMFHALLDQFGHVVPREEMISFVNDSIAESEARSTAALRSVEERLSRAVQALEQQLAGRQGPTEEIDFF